MIALLVAPLLNSLGIGRMKNGFVALLVTITKDATWPTWILTVPATEVRTTYRTEIVCMPCVFKVTPSRKVCFPSSEEVKA